MKNILIGVLLCALAYSVNQGYKWKQVADVRGWKADEAYNKVLALEKEQASGQAKAAYSYLSQPVMAVGGKNLSRADLLDLLLSKALKPAK